MTLASKTCAKVLFYSKPVSSYFKINTHAFLSMQAYQCYAEMKGSSTLNFILTFLHFLNLQDFQNKSYIVNRTTQTDAVVQATGKEQFESELVMEISFGFA